MEKQLKIELLSITPNAEEFIGKCSSICYDSSTEQSACVKRAAACVDKGHLATLRFAHAVFNVSDKSRACSHQFVRSKHLDCLQRSQRYCKESDTKMCFPMGISNTGDTWEIAEIYNDAYQDSLYYYNKLLALGIRKEDARFVLPEATYTEMNVVGNLQAWKDFIELRSGKHAQWEIREVAITINNILAKECPNIFKEINK